MVSPKEILREFRVGYAPGAWDRIVRGSREAGFSDEEILAAAWRSRARGRSDQLLDRFRARLMFPTADARGRVRGFGARTRWGRDERAEVPEHLRGEVYRKREVLYGIALARSAAAKAGRMVLCEGYTDVLALHQAGVRNAVGIMGTSLTEEQVGELVQARRRCSSCVSMPKRGPASDVRAAKLCAESGLELRVVPLPRGADPAS